VASVELAYGQPLQEAPKDISYVINQTNRQIIFTYFF